MSVHSVKNTKALEGAEDTNSYSLLVCERLTTFGRRKDPTDHNRRRVVESAVVAHKNLTQAVKYW